VAGLTLRQPRLATAAIAEDAKGNSVLSFAAQARWIAIAGLLLASPVLTHSAFAQSPPAAPVQIAPVAPVQSEPIPEATVPAEQSAAPPTAEAKSGLFEALGRWIDRNNDGVRDQLRGAQQQIDAFGDNTAETTRRLGDSAAGLGQGAVDITKGAVEVTKGAVDSVAKIPSTRVMRGHERCALAPNGAPDCVSAADALCRKNGFSSGKSLDFTSAEECPRLAASGQIECITVTFISRAMCQ
jgi:hypothetical protein